MEGVQFGQELVPKRTHLHMLEQIYVRAYVRIVQRPIYLWELHDNDLSAWLTAFKHLVIRLWGTSVRGVNIVEMAVLESFTLFS